jgi:hypothetical protein
MPQNNMSERRQTIRSPFHSSGFAMLNGERLDFKTHDVSLGGSLVELDHQLPLEAGTELDLHLIAGFGARARVCWSSRDDSGKTMVGFKFEKLDFSESHLAFTAQ